MSAPTSIDNQIARYVTHNFNAELEAQYIFKSYGENDISKQLNDMTTIQTSIETVLRQKVRNNYSIFLVANEEIHQVDEEMADLKHLILNTQKLINDVYTNSSKFMLKIPKGRRQTMSSFDDDDDSNNNYYSEKMITSSDKSKELAEARSSLPVWLTRAPEDLSQFIVEQQYSKAVLIIMKCRAYVISINKDLGKENAAYTRHYTMSSDSSDSNNALAAQSAVNAAAAIRTQALIELLEKIDILCSHLALTIERSIMNLPNSSLWGKVEQNKLLRLLITLEEFDMAVEGFANSKIKSVQNALARVDVTDDTLLFASDLSSSFFSFLLDACRSFQELFEAHYEKPETLNLLLCWIQKQVAAFVEVLSQQMEIDIRGLTNTIIAQFQKSSIADISTNSSAKARHTRRQQKYSANGALINRDNNKQQQQQGMYESLSLQTTMETYCGCGPLSLLSHCLNVAYTAAREIDSPSLEGSICLGWTMIPVVQTYVQKYAEAIIEQISSQIQQDSWMPMAVIELRVRTKRDRHAEAQNNSTVPLFFDEEDDEEEDDDEYDEDEEYDDEGVGGSGIQDHKEVVDDSIVDGEASKAVRFHDNISRSYAWLVSVLTHYCDEVLILLKAESEVKTLRSVNAEEAEAAVLAAANKRKTAMKSPDHSKQETSTGTSRPQGYTRNEMCEIEPIAVSCIQRIFLQFVIEVQCLNTQGFTQQQMSVYIKTLEAVVEYLVPSLSKVINQHFYCQEIPSDTYPPETLFKNVAPLLQTIISERRVLLNPENQVKTGHHSSDDSSSDDSSEDDSD